MAEEEQVDSVAIDVKVKLEDGTVRHRTITADRATPDGRLVWRFRSHHEPAAVEGA